MMDRSNPYGRSASAGSRAQRWGVVGAALLMGVAYAQAAPYTLYFSGTTTYEADYVTSTTTAGGTPFSGWLTFDIAGAEYTNGSSSGQTADSQSNCYYYYFGSCGSNYGPGTPVVTDYLFMLGSNSYVPITAASPISSFPLYDRSYRHNYDSGSGSEQWTAAREQSQSGYSGNPSGAANYSSVVRYLQLSPYDGSSLLAQPYTNLEQGFDLASVPTGQSNVIFTGYQYSQACTNGTNGCGGAIYSPGSFYVQGTLTSATFVEGVNSVPEPGALALLGIGLLVITAPRRNRFLTRRSPYTPAPLALTH